MNKLITVILTEDELHTVIESLAYTVATCHGDTRFFTELLEKLEDQAK